MKSSYRKRDWLIAFLGTWLILIGLTLSVFYLVGLLDRLWSSFAGWLVLLALLTPVFSLVLSYLLLVRGKRPERKHGFWMAIALMLLLITACFGWFFSMAV